VLKGSILIGRVRWTLSKAIRKTDVPKMAGLNWLLPFNEFPQTNLEQRFTRLRKLWPLALTPGRHYPDRGGTTPSPT